MNVMGSTSRTQATTHRLSACGHVKQEVTKEGGSVIKKFIELAAA